MSYVEELRKSDYPNWHLKIVLARLMYFFSEIFHSFAMFTYPMSNGPSSNFVLKIVVSAG